MTSVFCSSPSSHGKFLVPPPPSASEPTRLRREIATISRELINNVAAARRATANLWRPERSERLPTIVENKPLL